MKVAVVDLGTNTCRLFLADVTGGRVEQAERLTTVVRLGQGVDETGRLHDDAVARTHACLAGYAPRLEAYGPARRLLIATSVLRDAKDGRQFLKAIKYDFALPWRILSGEEEGTLAFRGGTSWLAPAAAGARRPARLRRRRSGRHGRPAPARRHRRRQHRVRRRLRRPAARVRAQPRRRGGAAHRALLPPRPAGGGGGRGPHGPRRRRHRGRRAGGAPRRGPRRGGRRRHLHDAGRQQARHDRVRRRGSSRATSSRSPTIDAAVARFAALTSAERGRLPGIQPGREDVILAGALIAGEACRAFGLDAVRVSEADLLEGAALALADGSLTAR